MDIDNTLKNVPLKNENPSPESLNLCYKYFGHASSKNLDSKKPKYSYFMLKTITFTVVITSLIIVNKYMDVEKIFKVTSIDIINKITYILFLAIVIFSSAIVTYHIL
uniref:Uncharacterized protein n=1 Tax=viral metagenome TaxID=1070528 RepID=A0A6C0J809_9ZZZZ